MLSEEKKQRLKERIAEWGTAEGVPEDVQEKVYTLGAQDPVDENDLRTVCDTALLSYKVIDWYMKFVEYLEQHQPTSVSDPVVDAEVTIKNAIVALQKALEVLEARSGQ